MFGPASIRIHPTFTTIKDWSGHGKPDGIEAVLEVQDQFGDPTRAAGAVRFELYNFMAFDPQHRTTHRLAMWTFSLNSKDDQVAHWDTAARGYSFHLDFQKISSKHQYVLLAQFDRAGGRMFDQINLEPADKAKFHGEGRTQHAPINAPGHGGIY